MNLSLTNRLLKYLYNVSQKWSRLFRKDRKQIPPLEGVTSNGKESKDLLREFTLTNVPEFQEFQAGNPKNEIDSLQTAIMYGRAIHWISFLDIVYPDFKKEDYVLVEVAYLIHNDPGKDNIPAAFYKEISHALLTLWNLQLSNLYPNGDWSVEIFNDPEISVQAHIRSRGS